MAISSITVANLTSLSVPLADLGVTVPGSGQVVLSETLYSYEILTSQDLLAAVTANQVVLNLGSGNLTTTRSLEILSKTPTAQGVTFDPTISGLTASTVQEAFDDMALSSPARIDVYDSTGGQTYTTNLIVVGMDTVRANVGSAFTLLGSGAVQCDKNSTYRVAYDVTLGLSTGTARSNSEVFLYLNGSPVDGTREPNQGFASCRILRLR